MYYYATPTTFVEKFHNFFVFLGEFFIDAHLWGFELLQSSPNIFEVVIALLLILTVAAFDLFILYLIYILIQYLWIKARTKEIKEYKVTGKIIKKSYRSAHTTIVPIMAGKVTVMSPRHHPEAHNLTVQYKDLQETFNNESLYNSYKENDNISLILVEKLDKKGKIIEATLNLPE